MTKLSTAPISVVKSAARMLIYWQMTRAEQRELPALKVQHQERRQKRGQKRGQVRHQEQQSTTLNTHADKPYAMIVSAGVPPSWSGQAIALGRLCTQMDLDSYCFATPGTCHRLDETATSDDFFPVPYHELPPESIADDPVLSRKARTTRLRQIVRERARNITRVLADEGCDVVVGCTGDLIDPLAAMLAAQHLDIPFHLYIFDDYEKQWANSTETAFANEHGPDLVRHSSAVFVPNEFMAREIRERHNIEPVIVRNCCSREAIDWATTHAAQSLNTQPGASTKSTAGPVVLYTGAVYHVNGKTINLVAEELASIGEPNAQLILRTAQSAEQVANAGITSQQARQLGHISTSEIVHEQRAADALLIPFNFTADVADIIRTSAPMKLGDYLASGTPILAVVPPDSFIAHHLQKHDCAVVVTEPDPKRINEALQMVLHDNELRERIAKNAAKLAITEYNPKHNYQRYLEALTASH